MEKLLDSVNITCNKNTIPNDPKSPFVTSGIRLGTASVTSRGMKTEDMDDIAAVSYTHLQQDVWISQHRKDSKKVRRSVKNMELTVL